MLHTLVCRTAVSRAAVACKMEEEEEKKVEKVNDIKVKTCSDIITNIIIYYNYIPLQCLHFQPSQILPSISPSHFPPL